MQKVMATTGGMGMGPGGPGMINIPPSILNNPNIPNEIIHALQAGRLGSTVFVANVSKREHCLRWKSQNFMMVLLICYKSSSDIGGEQLKRGLCCLLLLFKKQTTLKLGFVPQ